MAAGRKEIYRNQLPTFIVGSCFFIVYIVTDKSKYNINKKI